MRTVAISAAVLSLAACAHGAMKQSESIVRLLNSRSAQSGSLYEEAARRVLADAERGLPLQRFMLAVLADNPDLPDFARPDAKTRAAYLASSRDRIKGLAERKDNPLAWYLLSIESNDHAMLEKAANGGNVQALNALGTLLLSGAAPAPQGPAVPAEERAFGLFKLAAAAKDPNALFNLGMCYMRGIGCKADEDMAFECFRVAAELDHPSAVNNLGGCYRDGIVVQADPAAAAKCFAKSAELGDMYGQLNYALALQRGDGVPVDEKAAARLFYESASQGCAEAMDAYGMCFHSGRGLPRDAEMAAAWFRKSAEAGFPPAMDNLSDCYAKGRGVEMSESRAMLWKMRARAARGDGAAVEWLKSGALPDGR